MKHDVTRVNRLYMKCRGCGFTPEGYRGPAAIYHYARCPRCGDGHYNLFIEGEDAPINPVVGEEYSRRYPVPRVDDLGSGEDRIYGRWTSVERKHGLEVYLSCPVCGGINNISDAGIAEHGECECFHCAWCAVDMYVTLNDWLPSHTYFVRNVPETYTVRGTTCSREEIENPDPEPCNCDECIRRREDE